MPRTAGTLIDSLCAKDGKVVAVPDDSTEVVLWAQDMRGPHEQFRFMLCIAGIPFTDVRTNPFQGYAQLLSFTLGRGPALFNRVPALQFTKLDADGKINTWHCSLASNAHAPAMMRLMDQAGLAKGLTPWQCAQVMVLHEAVEDTRQAFYSQFSRKLNFGTLIWSFSPGWYRKNMAWFGNLTAEPNSISLFRKSLKRFEFVLNDSGGPYLMGKQMTSADISLFDCLNQHVTLECYESAHMSQDFKAVEAFYQHMLQLPGVKAWIEYRYTNIPSRWFHDNCVFDKDNPHQFNTHAKDHESGATALEQEHEKRYQQVLKEWLKDTGARDEEVHAVTLDWLGIIQLIMVLVAVGLFDYFWYCFFLWVWSFMPWAGSSQAVEL